jgi:hypothetical protein
MSKKSESQVEQSCRFIEAARELECDEDEAAFDEKLRRIATTKSSGKQSRNPLSLKPENRNDEHNYWNSLVTAERLPVLERWLWDPNQEHR